MRRFLLACVCSADNIDCVKLVEEPFVTSARVLATFRLDRPTTSAPLKTLRRHGWISRGRVLRLGRSPLGETGRLKVHSALNIDAVRAVRLEQHEEARALAAAAEELEQSIEAATVFDAIARVGRDFIADPDRDSKPAWRAYRDARRRASWMGLDEEALIGQWLVSPAVWLDAVDEDTVRDAVDVLTQRAALARENSSPRLVEGISVFLGVVMRMNRSFAEIQSENHERTLVPRADLRREGLDWVGCAVSVIREELPSGHVVNFTAPAGQLEGLPAIKGFDPFGEPMTQLTDSPTSQWLEGMLRAEPSTLLVAPLPVNS